MRPPGGRKISLAHLSLIESDPCDFVRIAAKAGFDSVDLRLSPATAIDRVYTAAERAALCGRLFPILQDTGLKVWDVEIIRIDARTQPVNHLPLLEAAAVLGARRVKVVCDSDQESVIVDALSGLCELAAPLGLTVDLEYMVFSGVKSLSSAVHIVHRSAQPNLQVLVDALHWMRANDTLVQIRTACGNLGYVQLCDGPLQGPKERAQLIQEARTDRLPPGQGEFPLGALLQAMPAQCVVSLEVPLPPGHEAQAHAQRLLTATLALLAETDQGSSS